MDFKQAIIKLLKDDVEIDKDLIEVPPNPGLGDYAVPMFKFGKAFKKSPVKIAEELKNNLSNKEHSEFERIENKGPYLNFFVDRTLLLKETLSTIINQNNAYGNSDIGEGKSITIDYSSPNIAKPFGIAHIRSTVIGNSLYEIFKSLGYKVWRINHLGDWGTQFGKLMVAYKKWGDKDKLENDGIHYLMDIYVKFGKVAKEHPEMKDDAREWFKKLEDGDSEAIKMWKKFREISLQKFKKYYKKLGVEFDFYHGESFYNEMLEDTIDTVQEKLLEQQNKNSEGEIIKPTKSEGALIVPLESKEIETPLLLRKSDGATTYHTRDLAAALYRINEFDPELLLYVVGTPQKLHFNQLFATLELMGYGRERFVHIPFGNMTYEGVMMSTRKGNFIALSDVLEKAISLARETIEEKNPDHPNKEEVAQKIGIGAIIFGDLSNDRIRDVDFKWEKALSFEGDSAPYLQYVHARICSIKRKIDEGISEKVDFSKLKEDIEFELAKMLGNFPKSIKDASEKYKPSLIANYLLELGKTFNKFYNTCRIKGEEEELKKARLLLAECTRIVIKKGLKVLCIEAPEEM